VNNIQKAGYTVVIKWVYYQLWKISFMVIHLKLFVSSKQKVLFPQKEVMQAGITLSKIVKHYVKYTSLCMVMSVLPHKGRDVPGLLPLVEYDWLKWSCGKYDTQRQWFSPQRMQCRQKAANNLPALKPWQHASMHAGLHHIHACWTAPCVTFHMWHFENFLKIIQYNFYGSGYRYACGFEIRKLINTPPVT